MYPEDQPLVSVIVPVYNDQLFVAECLRSIARQTISRIEVIVVNDGSDDESEKTIQAWREADPRFRVFSQSHKGPGAARNIGIENARGEYVSFVDADDVLAENALELMLEIAKERNADAVITKVRRGLNLQDLKGREELPAVRIMTYRDAMKRALYQRPPMSSLCGTLIKRSLIGDKRMTEGILYEDLDAFYHFYEGAEKIAYLDATLYFYRPNQQSIIGRWNPRRLDVLDVTERMEGFFSERYPELVDAAADRRFSANYNMLLLLLRHRNADSKAIARCFEAVKAGRKRAMTDRNVRIKNKIGALISYGGIGMIKLISMLKN